MLPRYLTVLTNSFSNLDETYREYSPAASDALFRFWRSKVKVTAGRQAGEGIYVDAVALKSNLVVGTVPGTMPRPRGAIYNVCVE